MTTPGQLLLDRFRSDLDRLIAPQAKLAIAVSGGPDSLALLLLAATARPEAVEAATVDHGLRRESSLEAALIASICAELGVQHSILTIDWPEKPQSNVQAAAREARYAVLADWAGQRGIVAVATAHHADDQAETLLMRLARGSGVAGLGGARSARRLGPDLELIRPLLAWRRDELREIVEAAGLRPVDDPTNRDDRFDRTAARALLASVEWLDASRLAASASHCRDAAEALDWAAARELDRRCRQQGDALLLDMAELPPELKRRLLIAAMGRLGAPEPSGPDLMTAIIRLEAGEVTTLAGIKLEGRGDWRLSVAPPRRR